MWEVDRKNIEDLLNFWEDTEEALSCLAKSEVPRERWGRVTGSINEEDVVKVLKKMKCRKSVNLDRINRGVSKEGEKSIKIVQKTI